MCGLPSIRAQFKSPNIGGDGCGSGNRVVSHMSPCHAGWFLRFPSRFHAAEHHSRELKKSLISNKNPDGNRANGRDVKLCSEMLLPRSTAATACLRVRSHADIAINVVEIFHGVFCQQISNFGSFYEHNFETNVAMQRQPWPS